MVNILDLCGLRPSQKSCYKEEIKATIGLIQFSLIQEGVKLFNALPILIRILKSPYPRLMRNFSYSCKNRPLHVEAVLYFSE